MATNNPYNNLKQYRYESYTGTIDGIWQKTCRIIANLNALLEVSDEKKAILHPTTYGIIKGEAIGLRAFLHFELLRIFGWGNLENQPSNLDKLSIPYVTEYRSTGIHSPGSCGSGFTAELLGFLRNCNQRR